MEKNKLFYGDNLQVLRRNVKDESVDLCYIDPPFNSKRDYNMIYLNNGSEDRAQAKAFVDIWNWGKNEDKYFQEIYENERGIYTNELYEILKGLIKVLGKGDMTSYLINMAVRACEIHRVLKSTGSFFLHCDSTASHYLKVILDAIFVPKRGLFHNHIIWNYNSRTMPTKWWGKKHDDIFFYTKSMEYTFNIDESRIPYKPESAVQYNKVDEEGKRYKPQSGGLRTYMHPLGQPGNDVWDIQLLGSRAKERLGYDTQKPELLLEKIIKTCSNEDDVVLDAFCGCGTTVAVAQKLNRKWIGIDITYQAISLIIKRLEDRLGVEFSDVVVGGVPKDIESARALATRQDDRTRKEFEKWAVLEYSKNRGIVNEKKGGDGGIDGIINFIDGKALISVKSDKKLTPSVIRDLNGTLEREEAQMGILLTLDKHPNMIKEAQKYGFYTTSSGIDHQKIIVISAQEIIDGIKFPLLNLTYAAVKSAEAIDHDPSQISLLDDLN